MKEIVLRSGDIAIVDDEDFSCLSQHEWGALKTPQGTYARRYQPFDVGTTKKKFRPILMHRAILCATKEEEVDHVDRNTLNNTRGNLRVCTSRQNKLNRPKAPGKHSSIYKGVHWNKTLKYWVASTCKPDQKPVSKYAKTETEAAAAYNALLDIYDPEGFSPRNVIA